ncbi:MAG: thiosulfate/3-mercaptopyruvate sulfurtransferase, partial [Polaribacter sp.]
MDTLLQIEKPLVSVNWLYQHKDATNLIVLDGTIPKVTQQKDKINIEETQIPTARFFDIKKIFSIQDAA